MPRTGAPVPHAVPQERFTLPEELLLLAWDTRRGRPGWVFHLGPLLAGAMILELSLGGHVDIIDQRIHARTWRTGEPHLDRMLDEVRGRSSQPKVKALVQRVGQRRWPKSDVVDRLVQRGILGQAQERSWGPFRRTRHPVLDAQAVLGLRSHVAEVLLAQGPVTVTRDAMLGALVAPAGGSMLTGLVPSDRRRDARRRSKELAKGEGVSAEVARAIEEINAAVVVAITAGAAAAGSG